MTPLLFAAALALSTPPSGASASAPVLKPVPFSSLTPQDLKKLSPRSRQELASAGLLCHKRTVQTSGPDYAPLKKLGDLPPALLEHAVNRLVNGCPVREIVYGGQTYYLDAASPTIERLDPVSHVTKTPAKER